MNCKSQISLEYLILTGFILVAVITPILIWVYSSATGSVGEKISGEQAVEFGEGLTDDAKQVYYLGIYSKKLVTYQLPGNIDKMFVLHLTDESAEPDRHFYYFGFNTEYSNARKFIFESDVPLTSVEGVYSLSNSEVKMVSDPSGQIVYECGYEGYTCTLYLFEGSVMKSGRKEFKLETILDSADSTAKVSITPR